MKELIKSSLYKYKIRIIILFNLLLMLSGISIGLAYLIGIYLDKIKYGISMSEMYLYFKTFILIVCIELVAMYIHKILDVSSLTKMMFNFNYEILEHMKKLPLTYFKGVNTAYLTQKINMDCYTITNFILSKILSFIVNIIKISVILYLIFRININFFIISNFIIFLYIILYVLLKNFLYKRNLDLKEAQNKYFSSMYNQISHIKVIKINSWFSILSKQFKNHFESVLTNAIKYYKIDIIFSNLGDCISRISILFLLVYGGFKLNNNSFTLGQFIIIERYFMLLLESVNQSIDFFKGYQETRVAYDRLNEILSNKIEINGNEYITEIKKIQMNNLTFSYDKQHNIINNFNYIFEKGKIYCVIGCNGSGKSTLINLILGLYKDYDGEILYNDNDINNIDMYKIRKHIISVVEQEPILLEDTIKNNLSYGIDDISLEDIEIQCKKIGIYDFIDGLNDKFDTFIDENNSNLSGGQKQKLALVRALLKNSDVIIFDEPTSAVDSEGKTNLLATIKDVSKDKVTIIITHDKNICAISDEILDFDKMDDISNSYRCI